MKSHINIVIRDTNQYFALGLESLLSQHLKNQGWNVTFLSNKYETVADLLIKTKTASSSMRCALLRNSNPGQYVIYICAPSTLHNTMPVCMHECNKIYRHDDGEKIVAQIEYLLIRHIQSSRTNSVCRYCPLTLTPREWDVLFATRQGMVLGQVADHLGISIKTASAHKQSAMRKLGLRRNSELYHWLRHYNPDTKN